MKRFDSRSDFKTDETFANFRALTLNNCENKSFTKASEHPFITTGIYTL